MGLTLWHPARFTYDSGRERCGSPEFSCLGSRKYDIILGHDKGEPWPEGLKDAREENLAEGGRLTMMATREISVRGAGYRLGAILRSPSI
jgi:hypothetical protein